MKKEKKLSKQKIQTKIIAMMIAAILLSGVTVGFAGYRTAETELDEQGQILLQNSVESAIYLIEMANEAVESGAMDLEEAQESVKERLMGSVNEDGTRNMTTNIDLGENGYLVIYDETGMEVMHPSLEGENVWEAQDSNGVYLVQELIDVAKSGGGFTYYDWEYPNSEEIGTKISYNQQEPNWNWIVTASAYMSDYNSGADSILTTVVIIVLGISVLGTFVSYAFSRRIVLPIIAVKDQLERMANFDLRLSEAKEALKHVNRKDEIGDMIRAGGKMQNNIVNLVKEIEGASENVAASSEELTATAEESTKAADEVARTIEEMANGAGDQAKDTEEGAGHVNQLGVAIEKNQGFLGALNQEIENVEAYEASGSKAMKDLVEVTDQSRKAAEDVNTVIKDTKDSTEKIENASEMIRNIAGQTNLLALNAAIEAARAGEAGKGFAVVAEEIRKLAEDSNTFTDEIATIVGELGDKVGKAVSTMEEVQEISHRQKEQVNSTNKDFEGIEVSLEKMKEKVEDLNGSGEEMAGKREEIIRILENLSAASEENAAGTEEASASVEEQTAAMVEISNSSEALSKLAEEMNEALQKFKI